MTDQDDIRVGPEWQGKTITFSATIAYPGSRMSDLIINEVTVQVPNRAILPSLGAASKEPISSGEPALTHLRAVLARWVEEGSQPAHENGIRPWSTRDLNWLIQGLDAALAVKEIDFVAEMKRAFIAGYEQAQHNTSLSAEDFFEAWWDIGQFYEPAPESSPTDPLGIKEKAARVAEDVVTEIEQYAEDCGRDYLHPQEDAERRTAARIARLIREMGVTVDCRGLVEKWKNEYMVSSERHWGDDIAWGSVEAVAARLDEVLFGSKEERG